MNKMCKDVFLVFVIGTRFGRIEINLLKTMKKPEYLEEYVQK